MSQNDVVEMALHLFDVPKGVLFECGVGQLQVQYEGFLGTMVLEGGFELQSQCAAIFGEFPGHGRA